MKQKLKDRIALRVQENQRLVTNILNVSSDEYSLLVFEFGSKYALDNFTNSKVTKSKSFWHWYKIQHSNLDAIFIESYFNNENFKPLSKSSKLKIYKNIHNDFAPEMESVLVRIVKKEISNNKESENKHTVK